MIMILIQQFKLYSVSLFYTVLLLLFLSPADAAVREDLVTREGLYYKKFSDQPFEGQLEGRIQSKIKNGKRHGAWLMFDKNGQLIEKGFNDFGKKVGQWKYFRSDGTLTTSEVYQNGALNGDKKNFNTDGTISEKFTYLNGLFKLHIAYSYQQGALLSEISSNASGKHGVSKWYYRNGQVRTLQNNLDGKLSGVSLSYDHNGNIQNKTNYLSGEKNGASVYYFENGNVKSHSKYANGKLQYNETFYENGVLKAKDNRTNQSLKLKYLEFSEEGEIEVSKNYISGELNGQVLTKNYHSIDIDFGLYGIPNLRSIRETEEKISCKAEFEIGVQTSPYFCKDTAGITRISATQNASKKQKTSSIRVFSKSGDIVNETLVLDESATYNEYYSDGFLKSTSSYRFDSNDFLSFFSPTQYGQLRINDRKGNISEIITFEENSLSGPLVFFNDGEEVLTLNVKNDEFFDAKGLVFNGHLKVHTGHGESYSEGLISGGKKSGEWSFYTNDKLIQKTNYRNGKKHGKEYYYFTDAEHELKLKWREGNYENGERQGEYHRWFRDGKIEQKGQFLNDKKAGWWSFYSKNGQLIDTGRFDENGKKTGVWDNWFPDGQQMFSTRYIAGKNISF